MPKVIFILLNITVSKLYKEDPNEVEQDENYNNIDNSKLCLLNSFFYRIQK